MQADTWGADAVIFNTTPDDRGAEPTTVISVFLLRILASASRNSRFSARRKTEIFPTIVVIYRLNPRSRGSWFDPFPSYDSQHTGSRLCCHLLSLYGTGLSKITRKRWSSSVTDGSFTFMKPARSSAHELGYCSTRASQTRGPVGLRTAWPGPDRRACRSLCRTPLTRMCRHLYLWCR